MQYGHGWKASTSLRISDINHCSYSQFSLVFNIDINKYFLGFFIIFIKNAF